MRGRRYHVRLGVCIAGIVFLKSAPVSAAPAGTDCVRVELPSDLPAREAWTERLEQEIRTVTAGQNSSCIDVEVFSQTDRPDLLVVRVRFDRLTREALLNGCEVSPAQRPRTGALLAGGLLRQLLIDRAARQLKAEANRTASPPKNTEKKKGAPRDARSRPPRANSSDRLEDKQTPTSPWSAFGIVGASLFIDSVTAVAQAELGLKREFSLSLPLRISIGLLGNGTRASDKRGQVRLGGLGLRGGPEIGLYRGPSVALWICPSAAFMALSLSTDPAEGYRSTHSYRAVVTSELRLLAEYSLARRHRICAAVDVGIAPRFLRVQIASHTLLAYEGLFVGCNLGYRAAFL
jgi:hypothetical protein